MAAEFSELEWPSGFEATVRKFSFENTDYKWRKHLSDAQQQVLNECLGDTLKKYGYT